MPKGYAAPCFTNFDEPVARNERRDDFAQFVDDLIAANPGCIVDCFHAVDRDGTICALEE